MKREEIVAGLKSALVRGYSIDFAKKSFINAGYNPADVEDSAKSLGKGIISNLSPQTPPQQQQTSQQPPDSQRPLSQPPPQLKTQAGINPLESSNQQKSEMNKFKSLPTIGAEIPQQATKNKPKKRGKFLFVLLVILFVLVLGVLTLLIFSRETLELILRQIGFFV